MPTPFHPRVNAGLPRRRNNRHGSMTARGKLVAGKLYVHASSVDGLSEHGKALLAEAQQVTGRAAGIDFNVIRVRADQDEVALLKYSRFLEDAFPTLAQSWRVHVPSKLVSFRDYSQSLNPPVLHRKELLLSADHPDRPRFAALTTHAESIGLFDDTRRIGFLISWNDLIRRKGYRVHGHQLLPIGNVESEADQVAAADVLELSSVQRHLTALTRTSLSAPVQSLLRHALLRTDTSFFDYGCGKGDDLAGLASIGVRGLGWDPFFRPSSPCVEADVVNIGFVINVIEDFDERVEALTGAFQLCRQVMAVSAMLQSTGCSGRCYRDGILTGRNTFQKYYSQAELQQFIESVLDEIATPAGPGVFYVFKDRAIEHRYFRNRSVSGTRALRAAISPPTPSAPRRNVSRDHPPAAPDPRLLAASSGLWRQCLDLGRVPEPDEIEGPAALLEAFGTIGRAIQYCYLWRDVPALERSAAARRDELRVYFALQLFARRRRFQDFDRGLQRDVKTLFGSLANAEAEGQRLLYSTRDVEQIAKSCDEAAVLGLGWLEPGHALHLHSSFVERLPPILRVYVGCATVMYGDVTQMDLVKLHLQSGKVSLMRFDDFVGKPVPAMLERIKVRLRDQEVDIFEYGGEYPPPLLYKKSRFINEEFPNYEEQIAFDSSLEQLGLFDLSGFGPEAKRFWEELETARWAVSDWKLERSGSVPALDSHCSPHFTFRQLIECGDTWKETGIDNLPKQPETYSALCDLARLILEPVVEYFGGIRLTYGFCSRSLAKLVEGGHGGIEPRIDQHAAQEVNTRGKPICSRGGAAVDFVVDDEDMREVANWIAAKLPYDRLYYYGPSRPIHVSYGPEQSRSYIDVEERNGRRLPKPARRPSVA